MACDELLFLPGTPHGQTHGIEGPSVVGSSTHGRSSPQHEGDAAAGLGVQHQGNETEMVPLTEDEQGPPLRARVKSIDDDEDINQSFEQWDAEHQDGPNSDDDDDDDDDHSLSPENRSMTCGKRLMQQMAVTVHEAEIEEEDTDEMDDDAAERAPLQRFRENHPRIVRIGTFFFFRSSGSSTDNATYAPSGPSVFGAGLDLSMPILFNFHLFILAYNHITPGLNDGSETQAKILPLIFLSVLIVRSFFPPGRRRRFWSTMKFVAVAPFHTVRFRDAFLGDVLTSLVRPFQDILFALSYYGTVVYCSVIGSYSLSESGRILERSWVLHNVILPCCALLPLWWKFLQTLRQAYDANKRWPYLGDSFKYMSAAVIILYGMTHPEGRRSAWWIVSFALSVLYQIWWDTVMDWELFIITPRAEGQSYESDSSCCARISSLRPSSVILPMQMYVINPMNDTVRRIWASIPTWDQIQLRTKRLYKKESFYYRVFFINVALRFTWMLCFIPAYRLTSLSGEEKVTTFSSDVNSYIGVLLPVAEILRRCHWGFLRVEMETIRMMDAEVAYQKVEEENEAMDGSKHDRATTLVQCLPTWLDAPHQQQAAAASTSGIKKLCQLSDTFKRHLFAAELSLWAFAFVGFGYLATY